MALKLNHVLIRTIKTALALSVLLLLLSVGLCVTPFKTIISFKYFVVFTFIGAIACFCGIIPIKVLRFLAKFIVVVFSYFTFIFYLYFDIDALLRFELNAIMRFTGEFVLHSLAWLVAMVTACKNETTDLTNPRLAYESNLAFFKKFVIFMGVVIGAGLIVLFIIDHNLIQGVVIDVMWYMALYIILELLLIKVSRDTIYFGIRALDKQRLITRYVLFGMACGGFGLSMFLFKKRLDELFQVFVKGIFDFIQRVKGWWISLKSLIQSIFVAISLRYLQKIDDIEVNKDINPSDYLKDLGIDFPFNEDGLNGNPNGEDGGIGSIPGFDENFDFNEALGGLGLLGQISLKISESGILNGGASGGSGGGNASTVLIITPSQNVSHVFLKLKSFGDYNKKGFGEAEEYHSSIADIYGMNYLVGESLSEQAVSLIDADILSLTGQYFLPDYMPLADNKYTIQTSDVYNKGDTSGVYSVQFYDYVETRMHRGVDSNFSQIEKEYREFVYKNYTGLPESTRQGIQEFLLNNGYSGNNQLSIEFIYRTLGNYSYNMEYDRSLDKSEDVVLSFLNDYKEGICQHFASATVVMLRAMGIPARYVGGLHATNLRGGQKNLVLANAAHAWVEYYRDGTGWIRLDPTSVATITSRKHEDSYTELEFGNLINQFFPNGVPGYPEYPSNPNDPSNPDNPSNPDSPNDPSNPDDPSYPDSPNDPSNPDNPSYPDLPSNPSDPDNPNNPNFPGIPINPGDPNEPNEDDNQEDEELEEETQTDCNCGDNSLGTVLLVGGGLITATLVVLLVILLKKKGKIIIDKFKKKVSKNETGELTPEEEEKIATKIIRNSYKSFIQVAGKNGIRKYPADTTRSMRDKYNQEIGYNQAMEMLTNLYRHARYNREERLTMEDATQAKRCLEIIKNEFTINQQKKKEELKKHLKKGK